MQHAPPEHNRPALDFPHVSVIARVGRNHGHALFVSVEDVSSGVERSYQI